MTDRPFVSIIITLYKDLNSLGAVLESLQRQSYTNFEVIVAEDDNDPNTPPFLSKFVNLTIQHVFHPNRGNYKVVIQNEAIRKSRGEYLIFIDGDCVLFQHFIQRHVTLSHPSHVLCGRRTNLGLGISEQIKASTLNPFEIETHPFKYLPKLLRDGATRVEELISFDPSSTLLKLLQKRKKSVTLLGCHFSCHKKTMEAINGFDEGYGVHPLAHDTDLDWRFRAAGFELASCKYSATMMHLFHPLKPYKPKQNISGEKKKMLALKQQKKFFCERGLS